ncbi:flagellar hook-basal body complex protein FliE [Frondihabitans sp. VKM Ac-2883]|uniref:flagellar hook-basal body complex protein FliE n=1 Tax=Frondihabitans sp. VKM Ac-2883 TaxID=2783823 RepID=UPI00188D378A|nr:flagellar hook-basal body complex protein FliE [Frondihabitans sp. VKM Ac-2883]MBF4574963.1 flagellar hook-basal body complex protein FliE [Frondihabitans sp. VKM Ac-2883]
MPIYPVSGTFPTGSTALNSGVGSVGAAQDASAINGLDATPTTGASSFGNVIDGLQSLQGQSQDLAVKAVTGSLDDVHTATIAATRAQVTMELVAAVRNKGVDAFNEIMRMQA